MSLNCTRILEEAEKILSLLTSKGTRVLEIVEKSGIPREVVQGILYLSEFEGDCHHVVKGGGWVWFPGEFYDHGEGFETSSNFWEPDERQKIILDVLSREAPMKVFPVELARAVRETTRLKGEFPMSVAQTLKTLVLHGVVQKEEVSQGTLYWVEGDRRVWDEGIRELFREKFPRGVSLKFLLKDCQSRISPIPPNEYFLLEILSDIGEKRGDRWFVSSKG